MQRSLVLAATALAVACGSSTLPSDGSVATNSSALTASQCTYFSVNGKVQICHFTGDAKKPYNLLSVDTTNCIVGQATHPHDFVSVTGDCNNLGCLPDGAPVDVNQIDLPTPTPSCCGGLGIRDGVCAGFCEGVVCPPVNNPACYSRACNPATGVCETQLIGAGRGCGDECATNADCQVLVNGGPEPCLVSSCVQSGTVFVCAYAPSNCSDGNACTFDWCESGVGCHHIPISGCTP